MGTLTLDTKKRRVRRKRIIVKNRVEVSQPKPALKKQTQPKKLLLKKEQGRANEIEQQLAEKKAQVKINVAKQEEIQKTKKLAIRTLNKKLKADYPVWNSYLPMQMGVAQIIMDKFADIGCSRKAMRELIGCHCNSRRYLKNITKGQRYDLFTGDVVAEIEEMQINNARFKVGVYDKLSSKKPVAKKNSTGE